MIVGVTLAEKLEREKEHTKQKAILGYNPKNGSTQGPRSGMRNITKSTT